VAKLLNDNYEPDDEGDDGGNHFGSTETVDNKEIDEAVENYCSTDVKDFLDEIYEFFDTEITNG
jgi:hypothetical protein